MLLAASEFVTNWLSVIGVMIAAIAAVATLVAVHWARRTVKDGAKAAEDAAERHQIQMDQRERVAAADLLEQRLRQLERVSDLVREIIETASTVSRPLDHDFANARIEAMCRRLQNAIFTVEALGMSFPTRCGELANQYGLGTPFPDLSRTGNQALEEIGEIILHLHVRQSQQNLSSGSV